MHNTIYLYIIIYIHVCGLCPNTNTSRIAYIHYHFLYRSPHVELQFRNRMCYSVQVCAYFRPLVLLPPTAPASRLPLCRLASGNASAINRQPQRSPSAHLDAEQGDDNRQRTAENRPRPMAQRAARSAVHLRPNDLHFRHLEDAQ